MNEFSCHRRSVRRHRGLTLIETLLALTIGAMVVTTTSVVAIQSVRTQQSARRTLAARGEKERLLDQFEQDIRSLITWRPELTEIISLGGDQGELVTLTCLVTMPDPTGVFAQTIPARVTYREAALNGECRQIVREVDPFHPPRQAIGRQSPFDSHGTRRIFTRTVKSIAIEVFHHDAWHTPAAGKNPARIEGIRIRGQWADDLSVFERVVPLLGIEVDSPDGRRRP